MDPRLQEMLNHHEIRNVLAEYCHGCDRSDVSRMAGVYWEDSWDDHGPAKMPGRDFTKRAIGSLNTASDTCMHHLGQSLIRVDGGGDGNRAGAETYFIASLRRTLESGEVLDQMGGRYVDQLERRDGIWKIKHRVCIREWSIRLPVAEDWLAGQPYVAGERSGRDPSYAALGLTPPASG